MQHKYPFNISWSEEDSEFVAVCVEIPGLSGLGKTEADALTELKEALSAWLDHLRSEGLPVPQPVYKARAGQRR